MSKSVETLNLGEAALKISREISQATTMNMLSCLFAESVAKIRMTASACGMVAGPKALSENPFYFANWPTDWLKTYIGSGFVKIDPLPRWALISGRPVKWTVLLASLPRGDPGHKVYAAAKVLGFTEGLAVPLRSQTGALGLVTTGGDREALSSDEESFVITIANAVFHKAEQLEPLTVPPRFQAFSRRQLECLSLLHHGFTDKEIAQSLSIKIETVRSHLENARLKVGARSRTHLVGLTAGFNPR